MIRWPGVAWQVVPLAAALSLGVAPTVAAQQAVDEARAHYNAERFTEAIAVAAQAWRDTGSPASALVLARARLERFRLTGDAGDLDNACELLRQVEPGRLTPTQLTEWDVGVAESLFLQGQFGPAAELLDRLLLGPTALTTQQRDRLLDWWAQAVDRIGQGQLLPERERTYGRLMVRLEGELERGPLTATAPYWLAAAARAAGELDRAWNLAVAGWVHAPRAGALGPRLRADLDHLVLQAIIPELAARQTGRGPETKVTNSAMADRAAEWEAIKSSWRPSP